VSNQTQAKISAGIASVREWQRGAITYVELLRRLDTIDQTIKDRGAYFCRVSSEDAVRRAMEKLYT
jgi:hypothetical protein